MPRRTRSPPLTCGAAGATARFSVVAHVRAIAAAAAALALAGSSHAAPAALAPISMSSFEEAEEQNLRPVLSLRCVAAAAALRAGLNKPRWRQGSGGGMHAARGGGVLGHHR